MTPPSDLSSLISLHDPFPNLSEVILDTDLFTRSVDINDTYSLSQPVYPPVPGGHDLGVKGSTNVGAHHHHNHHHSAFGEFLLSEASPPSNHITSSQGGHLGFTNWNLDSSSSGPKSYRDGLESIPEYDVSLAPPLFYHPGLTQASIPASSRPAYSFPTTLQPREDLASKFILEGNTDKGGETLIKWPGCHQSGDNIKSLQRPEDPIEPEDARSMKSSKRSRRSTPNGSSEQTESSEDYASEERRIRKKCFTSLPNFYMGGNAPQSTTEIRRRDSIKQGLDELQRALPHLGSPEEEKISQASILYEAGKYIKDSQALNNKTEDKINGLKREIENLNLEIEQFQSELPENGVVLVPKVLASRGLADRFHDHVVEKTIDDWRYWVFTNIMGHFVHSFDREVDASSIRTLKESNALWISKNMSLHQLRKDAYRKLAKLCAKTSIVDDPSKLPEEALGFVTNRERVINTITETVPDKSSIKRY